MAVKGSSIFVVSVYGSNGQGFGSKQGNPMAFPSSGVVLRSLVPAESYQGVNCNTAIQLLPTGLNVSSPQYYTAKTITELDTLINA